MPRPLILLAGLHKTATTAVQRALAAQRKQLEAAGFAYPVVTVRNRLDPNHTRIFNTLFKRRPDRAGLLGQFSIADVTGTPEELQAFAQEFSQLIEPAPGLLMVAEGVSVLSREELLELRRWFEARGFEIQLLCHVRHLSKWLNSMVAQRVNSALRMTIAQAVDEYVRLGTLVRGRIENLRAVFPQARFCSYEQSVAHPGGPAGFLLNNAGIALARPVKTPRANEGGSDGATRAMSVLNEAFGAFLPDGSGNPRELRRPEVLGRIAQIGGRKFTLRPREAEPLLPLVQAENAWLRETFGPAFEDPSPVFPPARNEWTPESLRQLRSAMAAMPPEAREWMASRLPRLGVRSPPNQ